MIYIFFGVKIWGLLVSRLRYYCLGLLKFKKRRNKMKYMYLKPELKNLSQREKLHL